MKKIISLVVVPSSLTEANAIMLQIGECQRAHLSITKKLEADVASLRAIANLEAGPLETKIKSLTASLKAYADAHRLTLLQGEKKSVVLPGGEFGWRLPPYKVTFSRGGEEKAKQTITALGLDAYLRVITEVDKEALLRDRPVIAGVKYSQVELFYVKPDSGKAPEIFPGGTPSPTKQRA